MMGTRVHASILEGIDLPRITEAQARQLFAQGEEAVVWALLQLAALAHPTGKPSPSTPSSQIPPYQKENPSAKRKKTPGRKPGHDGTHRAPPERIDRVEEHTLERCPECGEPVAPPTETRKRVIEDIPVTQPEVVEHVIPRCYCRKCKKMVEPLVADALPKATLGHRTHVLSAWFHYGLGNTLSQVTKILDATFQQAITEGGLVSAWHRIAEIVHPWYVQIAEEAVASATLHADETGHRVAGRTHWLWCFTNGDLTYYQIDPSRGEEALRRFFLEAFQGVLITDFWGAYNTITARQRQLCLVHLLRELEKVDQHNLSTAWSEFRDKLKRLLKDAIRLSKREDRSSEEFASKRKRLELRLKELIETPSRDADAKRLAKRLKKYRHELFTFLDEPGVPFDNNHAEREIRPAVLMRKNSFHNMSAAGALTHSILMTVFRTLQRRGHHPVDTLVAALRESVATGHLPALPVKAAPDNPP